MTDGPNAAAGSAASPDGRPAQSPGAVPAPPPGGLPARRAAFDLLQAVLVRRRALDDAMEAHSGLDALAPRDRAFARLLVATCLRRLGQLDALIAGAVTRPLPRQAAAVRDVLRLGLCQLLFLGTPPHAAVDTSVALAEHVAVGRYKGVVNAVLRRLGREGPDLLAGQDAARLNLPGWLWQSWVAAYGAPTARAIAQAVAEEAPLDVTAKDDPALWAEQLQAHRLPWDTLRLSPEQWSGKVSALPGFADGAWWVQDAAAALPARLLGEVAGQRVLDLCAAPGGKTLQLAAAGARVTAVDRSAQRMTRLTDNLHRCGLTADTIVADALLWEPEAPFDAVLVDAPCSATGTLRRHPDIVWLKGAGDVGKLAALQEKLLARAVGLVRPGGLLVWCTCSLQPEEGPAQIETLLAGPAGAGLRRVPVTAAEIGGRSEMITPAGDLRTLPSHLPDLGGLDGFYACRLQRAGP